MPIKPGEENINNTFFQGYYKELWRAFIPDELTQEELDFILHYFHLQPGNKVLDLMCGYGRHAIGLARKGIHVSAIDNLPDYLQEIQQIATAEHLPLQCLQEDVINYSTTEKFDLVICMGNSMNFFNERDCIKLITSIGRNLEPGGKLLIHSWSLAEIVIRQFEDRSELTINDHQLIMENQYLFNPTRIETISTIIDSAGNKEIKKGIDYVFSLSEMQRMLRNCGFIVNDVFSDAGKNTFTLGEPRAYIVAEKR